MRTGFSFFSFDENVDVAWAMGHVKKAGYDGVELILGSHGYLREDSSERDILALKRLADDAGLDIPSVGVWSLWEHNLVSDSAATRDRARSIIEGQIAAAALLGARCILVVPGYVGCDFAPSPEVVDYDIAYDRAQGALSDLAELARDAQVKIGIENVWNRFLLSPIETARFVDEIGSPSLGVYLDVGNCVYTGYPEQWIKILGQRIIQIHLSDARRSCAGLGSFVDLFAGDVDFPKVCAALARIGYDDYLTLEMLPNYRQFPEHSCYSNKAAVDRIARIIAESPSE